MLLDKLKDLLITLNDVAPELSTLEVSPRSYATYLKARQKLLKAEYEIKAFRAELQKRTPNPKQRKQNKTITQ